MPVWLPHLGQKTKFAVSKHNLIRLVKSVLFGPFFGFLQYFLKA